MRRLLLALAILLGAAPAWADFPPPAVMIIDTNRILREAKAVEAIARQVESIRAQYAREVKAEEQRLREEDQELGNQRSVLAPDAYQERAQKLREKVASLQRGVQRRSTLLDRARAEAMRSVQRRLFEVVRELARKLGANLVVQKSALVWADEEAMEFTDDALEQLNEALPSVTVEVANQ